MFGGYAMGRLYSLFFLSSSSLPLFVRKIDEASLLKTSLERVSDMHAELLLSNRNPGLSHSL